VMTTDSTARRALAAQAQSQLAEIETDIDLANYEPSKIRPNATWLTTRRKALDEIGALGSPLLLSAEKRTSASMQIARRLEALAARFAKVDPQGPAQETSEWSSSPLFGIIDQGLLRLERESV